MKKKNSDQPKKRRRNRTGIKSYLIYKKAVKKVETTWDTIPCRERVAWAIAVGVLISCIGVMAETAPLNTGFIEYDGVYLYSSAIFLGGGMPLIWWGLKWLAKEKSSYLRNFLYGMLLLYFFLFTAITFGTGEHAVISALVSIGAAVCIDQLLNRVNARSDSADKSNNKTN